MPSSYPCGVSEKKVPKPYRSNSDRGLPQAPLNDAIEYQNVVLENDFDHQSEYKDTPTPELEDAWEQLWNGKCHVNQPAAKGAC